MSDPGRMELYRRWFTETGADNLTDQQLIEALLGVCHVSCARSLSKKLMAHYNTVWNVLTSPVRELTCIQGMDEKTAILINVIGNIYTRGQAQYEHKSAVTTPAHAAMLLIPRFRGLASEVIYAIFLDNSLLPRSIEIVSRGGLSSARLNIFPVLCRANKTGSGTLIIAHNHPTFDPTPSSTDKLATAELARKLSDVGILLLDHIIVAKDTFVSMASDGFLDTMDDTGTKYIMPTEGGVK